MNRRYFAFILCLLLGLIFSGQLMAQNTTNKGVDFWVAFTGHINDTDARMYLYITSDKNASGTVSLPGGVNLPFKVLANQVTPVLIDPKIYSVYISSSDNSPQAETGKGIHVTSDVPVAVYSHIFVSMRSASTLVLPVKALGREYYAVAYTQIFASGVGQNTKEAYSEFAIVGVEDNTVVEITPTANERNLRRNAGVTYSITLNKGDVYQYQAHTDITGSKIVSVAGADGKCKPIAVFSGSSWAQMCSPTTLNKGGGDNLYQQLYPIQQWGKEFVTAPFINKPYDIFRILICKDNTVLTINGNTVTSASTGYNPGPAKNSFNKGEYFEFSSSEANHISASEPICVAQYQISQACDPANTNSNNPVHPGDPEMTILNPVEQTLSKITVYSALRNQTQPPTTITEHYINAIINNADIASFKIDGKAPVAAFKPIVGTPFSYVQEDVTQSSLVNGPMHTMVSDGGFIAIAYGYGTFESYGYVAGANAKDLYTNVEAVSVKDNQKVNSGCVGSELNYVLTLPYITQQLTWDLGDGSAPVVVQNPANTSALVDGKTVYKYTYAVKNVFATAKSYSIKAIAVNPMPSGCDANEEVKLDLDVNTPPVAAMDELVAHCQGDVVAFKDKSTTAVVGEKIIAWWWDFGDANATTSNPNTSTLQNPQHTYSQGGTYTVKLFVQSETGCYSDVISKVIKVNALPKALFDLPVVQCAQQNLVFTDRSTSVDGRIVKWVWDPGDGNPADEMTSSAYTHFYNRAGTYHVSLYVQSDQGCTSEVITLKMVVKSAAEVDFDGPAVCMDDAFAVFTDKSIIEDHTESSFVYFWNFGDPNADATHPNTSTLKNPSHKYTATGTYPVSLTIRSLSGCEITKTKIIHVNGSKPKADFVVFNESKLCSNTEVDLQNTSTVDIGDISKIEIFYDFNGAPSSKEVDDNPFPGKMYHHKYPDLTGPSDAPYTIRMVAYSGITCADIKTINITLRSMPSVTFDPISNVCEDKSPFQLNQARETSGIAGVGTFSGPGVTPSGFFTPGVAGRGVHTIIYTYVAQSGCSASATQTIEVYPSPTVNAGADVTILEGGQTQLQAIANGGSNLTYKWSPSTGLSRDDISNPIATRSDDITYTVVVTNENGCKASGSIFIKVIKNPVIPNAFSPNGDNINDTWNIKYLESYPGATVDIYNRYGERVYHSIGYPVPWDGRYRGMDLPVGIYYYIIDPKNGSKVISGSLTIIR